MATNLNFTDIVNYRLRFLFAQTAHNSVNFSFTAITLVGNGAFRREHGEKLPKNFSITVLRCCFQTGNSFRPWRTLPFPPVPATCRHSWATPAQRRPLPICTFRFAIPHPALLAGLLFACGKIVGKVGGNFAVYKLRRADVRLFQTYVLYYGKLSLLSHGGTNVQMSSSRTTVSTTGFEQCL